MFRVIGVATCNIGSLPRNKYYYEMNIVGLYNWVGEKETDLGILEKVEFLKEINVFGKKVNKMDTFIFNRNELKLLDFSVITEDEDYMMKHETVNDFVGIPWPNINNLDFGIVRALQEEYID